MVSCGCLLCRCIMRVLHAGGDGLQAVLLVGQFSVFSFPPLKISDSRTEKKLIGGKVVALYVGDLSPESSFTPNVNYQP